MAVWIKPSGLEIEINDSEENIAFAISQEWERKEAVKPAPKKVKKAK